MLEAQKGGFYGRPKYLRDGFLGILREAHNRKIVGTVETVFENLVVYSNLRQQGGNEKLFFFMLMVLENKCLQEKSNPT